MTVEFRRAIPVLRIFDIEKAKEFYEGFLGFKIDWEHRFDDNAPLFMQVSRDDLILHLSEHHGDGCPGASVTVETADVDEFHRELTAKKYKYLRPGVEKEPWNAKVMGVIDPFGNRINFRESLK
jgi:catechol 2,3-dioxygenase-like lactoylglutathione lyase family enzyme